MMRTVVLLIFVFGLSFHSVNAQEQSPWDGVGIEANIMTARMIKHSKKILVVPDRSSAFELNFIQQTFGRKDWHQRRKYPIIGMALGYTDYGLDSVYGKCFSLYPSLQIPIITGKKLEWTCRLGFGAGIATRRYERHPSWDTLNTAIGSRLNNYSLVATDLRYRINKNMDVQLGGNFSHMSNAAFRRPNLGINLYGAHIGFRYFPTNSKPQRIQRELTPLKNRWLAQGRFSMSANEIGAPDGPLYPVYLASLYASKRYLGKNKVIAGIDYSYHNNIYAILRNNEMFPGEEKAHSWNGAVFIAHEFLFGRCGVMLQMGYYFKRSFLALDPYYQKIGGNYYLLQKEKGVLKELYLSGLLKTHKAEAELVEFGVGVGF